MYFGKRDLTGKIVNYDAIDPSIGAPQRRALGGKLQFGWRKATWRGLISGDQRVNRSVHAGQQLLTPIPNER